MGGDAHHVANPRQADIGATRPTPPPGDILPPRRDLRLGAVAGPESDAVLAGTDGRARRETGAPPPLCRCCSSTAKRRKLAS